MRVPAHITEIGDTSEISVLQRQEVDNLRAVPDVRPLQVKSVERVRDLGEVFTPAGTVQSMLDLLPADVWDVHPAATFLEPACGDGNFLVAILERKLAAVLRAEVAGSLPAGETKDAVRFHALEALASIYAVDISADNVIGGTSGHEVGARDRLLSHMKRWHAASFGQHLTEDSPLLLAARWVVEHNIQIGDMLAYDPLGTTIGRDQLPLTEYQWDPTGMTVKLFVTTLGAVIEASAAEMSDVTTLFGPPEPTKAWEGGALQLHEAPIDVPVPTVNYARNGKSSR